MKLLFVLFFISLLFGQLGAITLGPGVYVYIHDIFLVILLVFGLLSFRATLTHKKPVLQEPIIAFVLVGAMSLLLNASRFSFSEMSISALYLLRWALYAGIYFVIVKNKDTIPYLKYIYRVGVGFAGLGLVQYVLYPELRNLFYLGWDPHFYRLFSTLFDPNYTGGFLVVSFLVGILLWRDKKSLLLAAAQTLLFTALMLTFSRSSYGAFVVGICVWIVLEKQWKRLLLLAAFLLLVTVLPKPGGDNLRLLRIDSSLARFGNWQESIRLMAQSPLFGHGFNTLRFIHRETETKMTDGQNIVSRSAAGVDSSLLFVGVTTGFMGFAAYGWLLFRMARLGTALLKSAKTKRFGAMYLASIAALFFHAFFQNGLFYPWIMVWIWVMAGAAERYF